MKKLLLRVAAAAAVAGLFASLAPLSAIAATEPTTFPSTSNAPVYLTNGNDYAQYPAGTQLDWNQQEGIILSAIPTPSAPTDYDPLRFPAPTGGALTSMTFISSQGDEKVRNNWKAWGDSWALNGQGVWLPQVTPAYQSGPGLASVKSGGGTYSLGVAYLKNNDLTVVSAYFTTINVDAGVGTWKFATPQKAPTPVATITTLSADKTSLTVGASVKLTAKVTPGAAAGSVQFLDGTTPLGTSVVSTGVATRTVAVTALGSHSYTATYSPSSNAYSASTSSAVAVTAVAKKFTTTNKPTISGTAKVAKLLTAKVKAWNPAATFTYQWYANGTAIKGATKPTWKLAKAQKGTKITVRITGSRTGYASVSLTSKATAKVKK